MVNQIRPLARLFRGMADLIDLDHTSRSRYEAIAKAAGVVAARATAEELVAGRLWQIDGADLLAAAYAFHAGLPRQAATAAHVQAMQESDPEPPDTQRRASVVVPSPPGRPRMQDPGAWTVPPGSPASTIAPPLDPHRLPGPRLGELDPADAAKLWALVSELPGSQFIPRSLARGGGCPGCRPSIPWPRSAPGANTRHERRITYAPAGGNPKAGEAPGGILGRHHHPWRALAGRPSLQPP